MRYLQVLATIGLLALLLGLPTVNVEHFLNPPNVNSIIHPDSVVITKGIFGKTIDITIPETVMSTHSIDNVVTTLRTATSSDRIIFHLRGEGGDVETFIYLMNNVKESKATITAIVEGNVYSGHAYFAASFKDIVMMPNTFMMFHTFSGYGFDCSTVTGFDRTVSNTEHCQADLDQIADLLNRLVASIPFLTPEEKVAILHGHDVYITAAEFNIRMKDMSKATYSGSDNIQLPMSHIQDTTPLSLENK